MLQYIRNSKTFNTNITCNHKGFKDIKKKSINSRDFCFQDIQNINNRRDYFYNSDPILLLWFSIEQSNTCWGKKGPFKRNLIDEHIKGKYLETTLKHELNLHFINSWTHFNSLMVCCKLLIKLSLNANYPEDLSSTDLYINITFVGMEMVWLHIGICVLSSKHSGFIRRLHLIALL